MCSANVSFVLNVGAEDPSLAQISVIDTTTGAWLHTVTVARFPQALAVDEPRGHRHVFVVNADNTVRVLDAQNGRILRTIPIPAAPGATTTLADDARSAHVFLLADTRVQMMDARSGRVLRDLPLGLGLHAQGLAVDARTRRLVQTTRVDGPLRGLVTATQSSHVFAITTLTKRLGGVRS